MKRLIFLSFLLSIGFVFIAQAQSIKLPKDCRKILAEKFRGWTLAEAPADIKSFYLKKRPFEQPNLIGGDWNGDGKKDYAVLLARKNKAGSPSGAPAPNLIVAFLKTARGYGYFTLEGDDCLMRVKKGSKGFDYEKQKSFRYRRDAIFSYIWEKAGRSYIWRNKGFRAVATSD
ncbi:MAG: hypothetical protein M3384_10435 [Acidobacteriota bacterium]|nr:hypothetical protein [Acidobacteriota bacterium]